MIYTAMTKRAMKIAYNAHLGQVDKGGIPYIFHPIHIAEQMTDENATIVALLHDVAEDTRITAADLRDEGFSPEVIEALKLLTHDRDTPYLEYVKKLRDNPTARLVKLADLEHNSDLSRMDTVCQKHRERVSKYAAAIKLLEE